MYFLVVLIMLMPEVKPDSFSVQNRSEYPQIFNYSEPSGCYNKFVGSKGSLQNMAFPGMSLCSMVCEWDIDVTRGFVVELEFEIYRLPVSKDHNCDSYLEISYSQAQKDIKRRVCPTDMVDKISTGSQTVNVRFKFGSCPGEYSNNTYGFEINYRAVAVNKPGGSYAVTFVLLSFATVFIIALIFCCIRGRNKASRNANVPNNVSSLEPNAPTQAELQSAFELQRHILQAPQIEKKYLPFVIFQSRTSSVNSNIASKKSFRYSPHAVISHLQEHPKISIEATPHLVAGKLRKKFSSESICRIQKLRTRLVARFSSHSCSSDVSVFYEASDRGCSYSQLNCEDGGSPENISVPNIEPREIPSVVIELVD